MSKEQHQLHTVLSRTMSSVVRKSLPEVIRPSSSELEMKMTTTSIDLSSFDKGFSAMPATCFLVFEHPIHEPAETIRRGLSRALAYYYPIAGRLVGPGFGVGVGEVRVECNGEGVIFVDASANCALNDAEFFNNNDPSSGATTTMLPDDLAVYYPHDRCGGCADPLLMMQVTVFSCGGFVVGVTWNHAIADGAGMAQFLQAVGELASGLPAPSVVPTRCHSSLPVLPPVIAYAQRSMMGLAPRDFACLEYTMPSSLINNIKAEFHDHASRGGGGQLPCTVFEAVTAVLWQCRTRVVISESDPEAPSLLFIVANVRKHVGAKDGYYGNCVTGQLVVATSSSVANGPIMDIVKMIRHAKEQITKQLKGDDGGGDDKLHALQPQPEDMLRYNYNLLSVSSMRNIGLDEVEVGGRKPVRVMCRARVPHMTVPSCVVCLPWKGKDGANMVTRCVREEHVEAFLGELARFT